MRTLMVIVLALASATAAPVPKELKKQDDKTRILGTWVLARANENGKESPNYFWHSMTFDAEGNTRFQYKRGVDQIHQYTLDPAGTPKTLTWRQGANPGTGARPYEFRDGRLVMATTNTGRAQPATLDPGPGVIVLEYERADGK